MNLTNIRWVKEGNNFCLLIGLRYNMYSMIPFTDVQEQTKLMYGDGCQKRSYLWDGDIDQDRVGGNLLRWWWHSTFRLVWQLHSSLHVSQTSMKKREVLSCSFKSISFYIVFFLSNCKRLFMLQISSLDLLAVLNFFRSIIY